MLRIFSGDFVAGEIEGMQVTQGLYLGIAVLMVIPIVMVFLSLTLPYTVNRWTNIILAIFFLVFNLIGLPTYPSAYDKFLIVVGLVFNALTIWHAWGGANRRYESISAVVGIRSCIKSNRTFGTALRAETSMQERNSAKSVLKSSSGRSLVAMLGLG